MRVYLSIFLLWMVHRSDSMESVHQNIVTDAVRFSKAAMAPVFIGTFLYTQYGNTLAYPYPEIGAQLVQMGISLLFWEFRESAILCSKEEDVLKYGMVQQPIYNIHKRLHIAELCCILLFYAGSLTYHKNFTSSKHWVGVAQHIFITQVLALYALVPISLRAKEEEREFVDNVPF